MSPYPLPITAANLDQFLKHPCNATTWGERMCFLIVANGGLRVGSWGFLSFEGGHQRGLEPDDAFELMQRGAFMDGLDAAGLPIHALFKTQYLEPYLAKFKPAEPPAPEPAPLSATETPAPVPP